MVFPVAPPRLCCAHARQTKRPLFVQIVHSKFCDNVLSSLFIDSSLTAAAGQQWERNVCGGDGGAIARQRWCLVQVARRWQLCRCSSAAFVLGRRRRDDSANGVVVGDSGARGNVHRGRRGAGNAKWYTDNIICLTKYLVRLNNYFI